jgi:hypothetical protein
VPEEEIEALLLEAVDQKWKAVEECDWVTVYECYYPQFRKRTTL